MNAKLRTSLAALVLWAAGPVSPTAPALAGPIANPPERVRELLADSRRALEAEPGLEYDPHTVLVRFADSTPEQLKAFARKFVGATYIRSFNNVPGLEHLTTSMAVPDAIAILSMFPGVEFAEPDYVVHTTAIPNNARELPAAHANVVIANIDTGVDSTRANLTADLAANRWTNPGELPGNAIDDDANGYVDDLHGYDFYNNDPDPIDDNGHGTLAADLSSPSRIMALKILNSDGSGQISDAILALNYAVTMGATISTNSWSARTVSSALSAALDNARENGHRVLGAAGMPPRVPPAFPAAKTTVRGNLPPSGVRDTPSDQKAGPTIVGSNTKSGRQLNNADGNSDDPVRGSQYPNTSAQDLDIALGLVTEPVERFIPTIATWRYIQAAIDSFGEGRGIRVAGPSTHDGKVANGNNSVWFGVDFIADRADRQQFIGGEVHATGGCLAYIDTPASTPGAADLCFAVIRGSSYSVCRLPGVVRPGVRVSFQACCRLHQGGGGGDWQLNPFHGPPSSGDPPRLITVSAAPLGASLSRLSGAVINVMHNAGTLPGAMASTPQLLTNGAQASFAAHGSFTGKLFAFEYHPTTFNATIADHPQTTRAKISLTFRGLDQDPVFANRGTATAPPETTLIGPASNRFSTGVWQPPSRTALAGDLAALGTWLQRLGAGERCVAIVVGDSNCAAAEGGVTDALIQAVMTYYAGHALDARPDVYWSATMSDNHPLRQFAGLGGRSSFGGDVSANASDIPLVSGSGASITYPFPAPQAPFTANEWQVYAGSAMHVHKPGVDSIGLLSAFCTAEASDTARWRLPNIYAVQSTVDGVMCDSRSGHARLAGVASGLLYARSRIKAGDLVCLEAVLANRRNSPGGSVQFAVRAQDGADTPLPNGGRLATAGGGLSGAGWMKVDSTVNAVDAQREALALAYTGYPGRPLHPATMDAWSGPTPPSGAGSGNITRVRSEPWIVGETTVPAGGADIAISQTPVSYQPHVLLRRRTICSMFGLRIIGNLNPGQDHPRLPWTVAMLGIGGTNATDQMGWLFSDPAHRVMRAGYWGHVLECLNAKDAHVLIIHVESQNSYQDTGLPVDALDDSSTTWAGFTGAKIRALNTIAHQVGAASVCTIAINSPRLTTDNSFFRGNTLRAMAPLLEHCAAIDLFEVIGQRETQDSAWALYPYLNAGYDTAHPHYTVLGSVALGAAFAAGLDAAAANP